MLKGRVTWDQASPIVGSFVTLQSPKFHTKKPIVWKIFEIRSEGYMIQSD